MRTVANIKFGGKTPLASIIHGITLLGILLGLGFLVAAIPTACLAAILFKVGIEILDYRILPVLRKIPLTDLVIFSIVLFVTVYQDLMVAVAIGVVFSLLTSLKEIRLSFRSKQNHKVILFHESRFFKNEKKLNEYSKIPAIVLEPQESLFFGSVVSLVSSYTIAPKHEMLIIDMAYVNKIDISGIYALEDLINNSKNNNIKVIISNINIEIKEILNRLNFFKHLEAENYIDSKELIYPLISNHFKLD
tara:strand:- start:10 stop:753 length:744 start_codon:yes stop_codon:yes gene_type:complete